MAQRGKRPAASKFDEVSMITDTDDGFELYGKLKPSLLEKDISVLDTSKVTSLDEGDVNSSFEIDFDQDDIYDLTVF